MTTRARASLFVGLVLALSVLAFWLWPRGDAKPSRSKAPARSAEPAEGTLPRPPPPPVARLPSGCKRACDCCPSGRDCGAAGCDARLANDRRFTLRPEAASSDGKLSVCVGARCADLGGGVVVSVDELTRQELVVTVELPVASETGVFRKPIVVREAVTLEPPTGLALCRGLDLKGLELPARSLVLHLDPPSGPRPERCAKQP